MTYRIVAHPGVQNEIEKLFKKDKIRYEYIKKRLKILAEQPEIGKPLRIMEEVLYRTRSMDKEILRDCDLDCVREVIALERRV